MSVSVRKVENKKDLNAFVELPWKIYPAYPNWAPPLKSDVLEMLDKTRHPFYLHGDRELFLAYREDEVVGRIAAIVDVGHNEHHGEKQGSWGFFECADDSEVAHVLFDAVKEYHLEGGAQFLRGPVNPSLNFEAGLLVKGFELPAVIGGPFNPPYYARLIEECGFTKEKDLYMWRRSSWSQKPKPRKRKPRKKDTEDLRIRTFDMNRFGEEVALITKLFNGAWKDNWGFTPMTLAEMTWIANHSKDIFDPELCIFIEHKGEAKGFGLALPDVNVLLRKLNGSIGIGGVIAALRQGNKYPGIRFILAGLLPSLRAGASHILVFKYIEEKIRKEDYKYMEEGWVLEDNKIVNLFLKKSGSTHAKTYRLYRQEL